MKKTITIALALLSVIAHAQTVDLAVKDAAVFDTKTGNTQPHKTILISKGIIVRITNNTQKFTAAKTIDAKGRLVTPGFIDVHTHLTSVLGDYDAAPLNINKDSIAIYRRRHADTYLPYGITTVRMVGEPESWIPMTLDWQQHPTATTPDVYTCGAALVSKEEGRKTYINHVVVNDPQEAAKKVREYYDKGIRDIKLYWRLRYPEFTAALHQAEILHMNVCAHIDRLVTKRDSVLALGLKDIEHVHPYGIETLTAEQLQQVQNTTAQYYPVTKGGFFGFEMEVWNEIGENNPKMLHSIALLKQYKASLTPTIHIFGQAAGQSYLKGPVTIENGGLNTEDFTPAQRQRCLRGYHILMSYVKKMADEKIPLNLGTDCPDGGKAALSELLLLHEAGIPMTTVLQIGTLNSARAIGREDLYGSIEPGKRADLLIFDKNPLTDPASLLANKTIIKDGVVQ
jgi:imidazolonepropionase-like amidohydrolase